MHRRTFTAYVFLIIFGDFVTSSSEQITREISRKGAYSDDRNIRRFILTDNVRENWVSWQQHVACLTTCVLGYESETVECCTTGDNKLCYGLPWKLLNNSIGDCAGFCKRKEQVSCKVASLAVCGSDGKMYENSCEFAKAHCMNHLLIQKEVNFCNHHGVTITSSTGAMMTILTTRIRASVSPTAPTTKSTVPIIASTKSALSTVTLSTNGSISSASSNAPAVAISTYASTTTISTDSPLSTPSSNTLTTTAPTSAVSTKILTTPSYCQNRHSISCGFTFKIVCGSDGKYYANLCMLALGRCDNPYLTQRKC